MPSLPASTIDETTLEKLKSKLLEGHAREVEEELFAAKREEAAAIYQQLLSEVTESEEGLSLAKTLRTRHDYRILRKKAVTVVIKGGQRITVQSWYALKAGKKKGPFKKGRNGRGNHLLLSYWGYSGKCSPSYLNDVARCGVGSASYDLAEEELRSRGIPVSSDSVDHIVQHVGTIATKTRDRIALSPDESLSGKRVMISVDGGRIRSRQTKTGRPKKGHRFTGFETPWREPKLLVIAVLNENGEKDKTVKPVYEATMGSPQELLTLLVALCQQLDLPSASEIVCIGDGSAWVWGVFEQIIHATGVENKTTCIADFYHAVEHITALSELHTGKQEKERRQWAVFLAALLREGKFDLFKQLVYGEADKHNLPEMKKQFAYFETRRQWMHYDVYEEKKLPIGSGIVESAIKRVINARIKSPGSFWKMENVEKMLQLRCILMSGRWNIFMNNFVQSVQLTLK